MAQLIEKCIALVNKRIFLLFFLENMTNGTAESPASPNPGAEEPSIYYDTTDRTSNFDNSPYAVEHCNSHKLCDARAVNAVARNIGRNLMRNVANKPINKVATHPFVCPHNETAGSNSSTDDYLTSGELVHSQKT